MESRHLLAARVETLRQDLVLAGSALESPSIRRDLRDSVEILFAALIQRKTEELAAFGHTLSNGVSQDPGGLAPYWTQFEEHVEESDRLLREYFAFIEGALVRSAGLDNGICDLADEYLKHLARVTAIEWQRMTILADSEFFAPMTDIIRMRYPHFSIWNLPVLAHEFGHFVTPRLQDRLERTDPLREFRRRIRTEARTDVPPQLADGAEERASKHLDEFIADAFAAYAAGPAYVCACILLRFEPAHADEEGPDHPADGRRAYLLFRLLETFSADYSKVAGTLQSMWTANLEAAGRRPMRQPDAWLDRIASALAAILPALAPKARFDAAQWRNAATLSDRLLTDRRMEVALTPNEITNGAWLCRIANDEAKAPLISAKALELFLESPRQRT